MHRTIEGIGTAFYLPHELRLVSRLLEGGHYGEVEVIHTLKVAFGGCVLPADQQEPQGEQMELG